MRKYGKDKQQQKIKSILNVFNIHINPESYKTELFQTELFSIAKSAG